MLALRKNNLLLIDRCSLIIDNCSLVSSEQDARTTNKIIYYHHCITVYKYRASKMLALRKNNLLLIDRCSLIIDNCSLVSSEQDARTTNKIIYYHHCITVYKYRASKMLALRKNNLLLIDRCSLIIDNCSLVSSEQDARTTNKIICYHHCITVYKYRASKMLALRKNNLLLIDRCSLIIDNCSLVSSEQDARTTNKIICYHHCITVYKYRASKMLALRKNNLLLIDHCSLIIDNCSLVSSEQDARTTNKIICY